ncbi:MAG: hypothetical protein HYU78_12980 [Rhodocyclales bacterium]|nr:hypothetical protein [Rhodocyclales bacterium]
MSLPAGADSPAAADPVRAAFERLLTPAPTASASIPPPAPHLDPLLQHLMTALRHDTEQRQALPAPTAAEKIAAATPADPLLASFERMLGHEPTSASEQAATTDDPLTRQLAASLWRGQDEHASPQRRP